MGYYINVNYISFTRSRHHLLEVDIKWSTYHHCGLHHHHIGAYIPPKFPDVISKVHDIPYNIHTVWLWLVLPWLHKLKLRVVMMPTPLLLMALELWQLCHHWWQTKLASWWLPVFSMVLHVNHLSISFRVTSLALGQSYDCPNASEVTMKDMVNWPVLCLLTKSLTIGFLVYLIH